MKGEKGCFLCEDKGDGVGNGLQRFWLYSTGMLLHMIPMEKLLSGTLFKMENRKCQYFLHRRDWEFLVMGGVSKAKTGAISISDIELKSCTSQKDQPFQDNIHNPSLWTTEDIPTWANIIKHNKVFKVSFDMLDDLPNALRKALDIRHDMSRLVKFYKKKWYTSDNDGSFHLYGAFNNGHSSNTSQRKISVLGLVLTFN
ncbi:hypothetical protein ACROYT_G007953 [Oculina patagonica]